MNKIILNKCHKFSIKESPKTFAYVVENNTFSRRCNMCGSVVLTETEKTDENYPYQCMACDESLFEIQTHDGSIHTDKEFDELCCDTRDLLLLDYEDGEDYDNG